MVVEENEENPSVRFNKIVLTWDYLRLPEVFKEDKKKKKKGDAPNLPKVKGTYTGYDDYISTFEPLLFEEVRAQIVQNKDDEEGSVWIAGFVSKFTETDGFHLVEVRCVVPESQEVFISQNDLLFLSKEKFEAGLNLRLPTTHAFALVEQLQKLEEGKQAHDVYLLRLRMYLGEIVQVRTSIAETRPERIADQQKEDKKTIARLMNMRLLITSPNESDRYLHILKICSLSTIVREYAALLSINNLPFKNLILTAAERIPSSDDKAWTISKPLVEYMEDKLNPSQQEALNAGLSRKDFVLIQGPPGTGKTQTILGILSAVLHATPARVGLKSGSRGVKRGPEMSMVEKCDQWARASPWITGTNPRDMIMPTDGDSGFFPTTGNEFKPEVVNSSRKYRTRVLVCAPSNSALDEIISRVLKTGVRDEYNHAYNPKIVRVGLKAHYSVKSVSMDDLVKQRLAVHSAADKQKQGAGRDTDNIRASLLDEAAIVFSTLSFSGSNLFSRLNRGFDVVIIDEAAQAIEPATLIPLANGCKQVYLVGDPLQLPATVISPKAAEHGYGMSLFKRLQSAGYPVVMLKTQYRMHPEIRSFPSDEFYEGALEDGEDMVEKTERDWHRYRCFGPFCFFDIPGKESDASGSGSWVNEDEVDFVLVMYHKLVARYPVLKSSSQLAIICPYRHQLKLFKKRFRETFGEDSEKFVDINTVDGFQGREKDVAIFSCVRANEKGNIGFVSDARRMNVGITRARASVLVVGSASTLKKNDAHWRSLVESAERRNSLFKVPKPYESFFSDENLKTMDVKEEKVIENPEEQDYDTGPVFGIPDDAAAEPEDEPDFGDGDGDAGFDED